MNRQQKEHKDHILWQIECKEESEGGYHNGADVSMLSQFASEDEILFPPLTVLTLTNSRQGQRLSAPTSLQGQMPTTGARLGAMKDYQNNDAVDRDSNLSQLSNRDWEAAQEEKEIDEPGAQQRQRTATTLKFHRVNAFPTFV